MLPGSCSIERSAPTLSYWLPCDRQDKTRQDKTRQDKVIRQDQQTRSSSDKASHEIITQDKTTGSTRPSEWTKGGRERERERERDTSEEIAQHTMSCHVMSCHGVWCAWCVWCLWCLWCLWCGVVWCGVRRSHALGWKTCRSSDPRWSCSIDLSARPTLIVRPSADGGLLHDMIHDVHERRDGPALSLLSR